MLARECLDAGFEEVEVYRLSAALNYSTGDEACNAAFVGGPVALAWSRFCDEVRTRARGKYLESIKPWRFGQGYRVPGEFVVVAATHGASLNPSVAKITLPEKDCAIEAVIAEWP